jgi:hypothetical protein
MGRGIPQDALLYFLVFTLILRELLVILVKDYNHIIGTPDNTLNHDYSLRLSISTAQS